MLPSSKPNLIFIIIFYRYGSILTILCKQRLSSCLIKSYKELEELKELENNYYTNRTIDRDTYYNRRYEIYFKLWKEYLEDKKKFKDNKFIIKLDAQGYTDIYVKGLGSSKCRYTYYSDEAKVFKGNPTHILNRLSAFKNQSNIRVVTI